MKMKKGYSLYQYKIKKCPICGIKFNDKIRGFRLFVGDGYTCMDCGTTFARGDGREYLQTVYSKDIFDYVFGGLGTPHRQLGVKKYPAIWEKVE